MEEKQIKQCQYCKEDMKADAIICPHCRKKQKRDSDFKILPVIISFSVIAILVATYVLTMRSAEKQREKVVFGTLSNSENTTTTESEDESVSSEIVELWEGSSIMVTYDETPSVLFTFPKDNPTRQFYDYLVGYSILAESFDDFMIINLVEGEEEAKTMLYRDKAIVTQNLPESWMEVFDIVSEGVNSFTEAEQNDPKILAKELIKNLSEDEIKKDFEIISKTINDAVKEN